IFEPGRIFLSVGTLKNIAVRLQSLSDLLHMPDTVPALPVERTKQCGEQKCCCDIGVLLLIQRKAEYFGIRRRHKYGHGLLKEMNHFCCILIPPDAKCGVSNRCIASLRKGLQPDTDLLCS